MAVNYNLGKNMNSQPEQAFAEISQFFMHMIAFHQQGNTLQRFELKPDGLVTFQMQSAIPADQLAHLDLAT